MQKRKPFQFRLRPTKKQPKILDAHLEECRWLYNELLAQRKTSYEEFGESFTKSQQQVILPLIKEERPSLLSVHSQILQDVNDRLDKAFQAFFRLVKSGEKPGYPRFLGLHRYSSFWYTQSGFALMGEELKLSKIASIRIKMHRPIEGKIEAKIQERIRNQRKDFCHKESEKIIDPYQYICIEDLNVKNMVEGSHLLKNIADASWNQFCEFLTYKAQET